MPFDQRSRRPRSRAPLVPALAVSLLALATAGAGATEVEKTFPYPVHSTTLDNGLEVVVVPMSSDGLVAYWSIVRTGSRDEYEPGRTGFAHFFEHMMFRGTEAYPADVYSEILTGIGADTNAFTTDDLTAYHLSFAAEDLETVMKLESDRFQNLSYEPGVFETEAGAVYGEYRKNRTSPFFFAYEAVRDAAFDVHTYGHTTMGYEADIAGMPQLYDYSLSFFDRYYRPENVVLFIAGDVDVERTLELAKRYYGDWKPGYVAPQVVPEPPQTAERRVDVTYPGATLPVVWISYKTDAFDATDRGYAATALLAELAFGQTSDIYRQLVLEEQVVEFLNADLNFNRDPGVLDIVTRVKDPAKVDEVLAAIDRTLERYRSAPPDADRLETLQQRLRYGFLMALDTPSAVAGGLARLIAVTGGMEAVDQLYATYAEVTPQDVLAAAREVFVPQRRTVAVVTGESR